MPLRRALVALAAVCTLVGCSTNRLVIPEPTTTAMTLRQYSNETHEPMEGIQIRTKGQDTRVLWLATGPSLRLTTC